MEVYEIQKLQLSSSWDRTALTALLQSQGLRLDGDVETAFGVSEVLCPAAPAAGAESAGAAGVRPDPGPVCCRVL